MTILGEILDRVKGRDLDGFRLEMEAKESDSKRFINAQGYETITDVMEKRLSAEQMTFKIDEDVGSPLLSGPGVVGQPSQSSPRVEVAPDSDVYKKFLDQLK